jgi:prepilin signal peptidase PulO-like enzyme (type II secretory pathway)
MMTLMLYLTLAIIGLCLGSFVNALVWRIHEKRDFVKERSICPNCHHVLSALDLIPLISWLWLRGRCRYCSKPISAQYPLVELTLAVNFVLSYIFWPTHLTENGNWMLFCTWLLCSVGLLALAVYDSRWMLLPNKILYPTFFIAAVGNALYLLLYSFDKSGFVAGWVTAVIVASGLFWLLYVISKGRWIGYGDVRLGLVTGTLLHNPTLSFLMIFLASLFGVIFALPSMRGAGQKLSLKIPFGPFLILACAICLLWGDRMIDWYKNIFVL